MTAIGTAAQLSNLFQAGGSALSLVALTKTLVSAPGISMSITNPPLVGSDVFGPTKKVPFGRQSNFDVITRDSLRLHADITDHFTEANNAIQDHVAFDPARVTISGEVGELVFARSETEKYIQAVLDRLGPLGVIAPELTVSALEYLAAYNRLASSVSTAFSQLEDVAGLLGVGSYGLNKQQTAFKFFNGIFSNRIIVDVDTPWYSYESMLIEDIEFEQGEESTGKSAITVTFKQFRTVSTLAGLGPLKGRIADQAAGIVDKGVSKGTGSNTSILKTGITALKGALQ